MRKLFSTIFAVVALAAIPSFAVADERPAQENPDSVSLVGSIDDVTIIARQPKQHFGLRQQPISSSVLGEEQLQRERVFSLKDLSAVMPNFYQPDYGSKMTSSIYVRGFGARIDQPVIGLTVDGVPYLNKNNYDVQHIEVVVILIK
ncbi:MAG: Plug domain-containing protein, partial [Alistipes sp.]|nr:Plug domain-containing protein [Alistipes sp.]